MLQVEDDPAERDAAARAKAVTSLASVAHELYTPKQLPPPARQNGGTAGQQEYPVAENAAGDLERAVLPTLLSAIQDYSTDNRYIGFFGRSSKPEAAQVRELHVCAQVCVHTFVHACADELVDVMEKQKWAPSILQCMNSKMLLSCFQKVSLTVSTPCSEQSIMILGVRVCAYILC